MRIRRSTTSSQNVFLFGHLDTIRYKFQIRDGGLGQLLWAAILWFMWALRVIPTLPEYWYSFAAIYYLPFVAIWIVNIWMGDSRSKELFIIAGFANNIVFAVCIFVTTLAWYNLYMCWFGYFPLSCRNSGLPNILAAIFSTILLYVSIEVFIAYTSIKGRIGQSRSVAGITYPKTPL